MQQKDFKKAKDSFFISYKAFIDCIMLTHNEYSMYSILVLKKNDYGDLSRVTIIVRNSYNGEYMFNEYSNTIVLPVELADTLINDIRNDFYENHYITYSSVNPRTYFQTLQNSKFSLNIKLNNEHEYEEAINFSDKINVHDKRSRVLTRN